MRLFLEVVKAIIGDTPAHEVIDRLCMAIGVLLLLLGGSVLSLGGSANLAGALTLLCTGGIMLGLSFLISQENRVAVVVTAVVFSAFALLMTLIFPFSLIVTGFFVYLLWKAVYEVFSLKALDKVAAERRAAGAPEGPDWWVRGKELQEPRKSTPDAKTESTSADAQPSPRPPRPSGRQRERAAPDRRSGGSPSGRVIAKPSGRRIGKKKAEGGEA